MTRETDDERRLRLLEFEAWALEANAETAERISAELRAKVERLAERSAARAKENRARVAEARARLDAMRQAAE